VSRTNSKRYRLISSSLELIMPNRSHNAGVYAEQPIAPDMMMNSLGGSFSWGIRAVFSSSREIFRDTVALPFACGNYYPTID